MRQKKIHKAASSIRRVGNRDIKRTFEVFLASVKMVHAFIYGVKYFNIKNLWSLIKKNIILMVAWKSILLLI